MTKQHYVKTSVNIMSNDLKALQELAIHKQTTPSALIRIGIRQLVKDNKGAQSTSSDIIKLSKAAYVAKYYTTLAVATRLNVSKAAVLGWAAENKIHAVKVKVPGTPGSKGFRYGFPKEEVHKLEKNPALYNLCVNRSKYYAIKRQKLRNAGYLSIIDIQKDCGWSHRHILNMIEKEQLPMQKLSENGRREFRYVIREADYIQWKKQYFTSHSIVEATDEDKIQTLELDVDDFDCLESYPEEDEEFINAS